MRTSHANVRVHASIYVRVWGVGWVGGEGADGQATTYVSMCVWRGVGRERLHICTLCKYICTLCKYFYDCKHVCAFVGTPEYIL